jgi:mannosyltransferase
MIVTTKQVQQHPSECRPGSVAKSIVQRVTETDVGLMLALVVAAGVRLLGVFARPIWYDEAFAILFSRQGPARMLVGTLTPTGAGSADIHPLGYYSLLWVWMLAFGESLLSARGLSILAGLATVFVGYALARNLVDRRTAFVAASMLALSPFLVHYSQEIRMYAFLGLWLTLATFCFWKAVNEAGWSWWVGFAVSAALAQYTHNLAAAYLLALALWPVVRGEWKIAWRLALAAMVAVLLYMPWLVNVPAQFAKVSQAYWIERPPLYRLLALPLAFVSNLPVPPPLLGAAMFASLGVIVLGLLATARGARLHRGRDHASKWMLYMSFTPPLLLFLFSQWKPVFLERALIGSAVAFCIWLACQLTDGNVRPAARWILAALTALGFGIGLWQHLTYRGFPYAPYDSIAADLRTRLRAGDVIIHSSKLSFLPSFYFDRGLPETFVADRPGSSTDTLAPSTQMVLGVQAATSLEEAAGTAERVWFILFDQSNEEYVQAGYAQHPHLTWLLQNYELEETLEWDDLNVVLFTSDRPR